MTSITDKLAAANAAPLRHLDVVVSLDRDSSEKVDALTAELAASKESNDDRLSAPTAASSIQEQIDAINAEQVDSLVTLRLTRLPGDDWTGITRLCPPNPDSILDRHYKYSMDAASKRAVQFHDKAGRAYGQVVDGEELSDLTEAEWAVIFARISGPDFTSIVDTIYNLNVYGPTERYKELLKISASLTA